MSQTLELLQPIVYGTTAVLAYIEWRRHPGAASAWLAAAFGVLGVVVLVSAILPEDPTGSTARWAGNALISILVLFPYCLYRFLHSFVRPIPWIRAATTVLTAALAIAALLLPRIPGEGEPRPGWFQVFVAALLIQWVSLSGLVAVRLWRAGQNQPSVARKRMRLMSIGAIGLAMALVVAGEFSDGDATDVVVGLLVVTAAPAMLIGFAPPSFLRALWRRNEAAVAIEAERALMTADTAERVGQTILPLARRMLGAVEAVLETQDGRTIAIDRHAGSEDYRSPATSGEKLISSNFTWDGSALTVPLQSHRLKIVASPFTPFFGREELERVANLAALADLALSRNALLENERRLAAIVSSSDDAILSKSLDGIITSWNKGAERIYGYTQEEVVGEHITLLVPPELPDEVPAILEMIRSGESIDHFQTKRRTKDGRTIDVSVTISPLRNAEGEVIGASTIARDITESKRQQELLSAIFETSPDIIATITSGLELAYANTAARAVLGFEFDELFGENALHWVHPEDVKVALDLLHAAFRDEDAVGRRLRVKNASEEWIWLDLRIRRMGPTDNAVVMARDVTEQVRLEEELHAASRAAEAANLAKSEFLSRMSHELRTPLNAILGFGQLLAMEELAPEQRQSTEQIIKGGQRLLELINEVLDISRIESGTLRLSVEPVPVEAVIDDALEFIRPLADARGLRLRREIGSEVRQRHVVGDQQRLGQVLLNLLSNAVKYNVEQGTVSVTVLGNGQERLRIGITDTGPGIPEDKIPLLFTPFERLGAEQSGQEGTGLGLTLSKSLIEAMGGSLEVDTMAGHGTTFWVELQATQAPAESPRHTVADSADAPETTGGSILYIEDNLSNLALVERLVARRKGLELVPAMTGTLGIELATQRLPDLIFLDLHLPDVGGDEVLLRLRKDPRTRDIPIVVLSADATPGQIRRMRAAGANDYLTKPVDVAMFMSLLDRFLEARQRT